MKVCAHLDRGLLNHLVVLSQNSSPEFVVAQTSFCSQVGVDAVVKDHNLDVFGAVCESHGAHVNVTWVRVAVDKTFDEDHVDEGFRNKLGTSLEVDSLLMEVLHLCYRCPIFKRHC